MESIFYSESGGIKVYKNNGQDFALNQISWNGNYGAITVADLDNDGYKEIIASSETTTASGDVNGISVWRYNPTANKWENYGATQPLFTMPDYRFKSSAIVCDIDGDGYKEIITTAFHNNNPLTRKVFVVHHNGTLDATWNSKNATVTCANNWHTHEISVGDLDNDGNLEVVALGVNTINIWDKSGTLIKTININKPDPNKTTPILADVDGDPDIEILISCGTYIDAYKINGKRALGFPLHTIQDVSGSPCVADIDRDGKNEVITGAGNQIYVWKTNGVPIFIEWGCERNNCQNTGEYTTKPCQDIVININTTWNTPQKICTSLKINKGATLTINNTTVYAYENAKIIIQPGAKLIVNNSKITNATTDKRWKGIFVAGTNGQIQTPQYQGVLQLTNSIIENAIYAIVNCIFFDAGYPSASTIGGIVQATNTIFRNNKLSVEFLPYQNMYGSLEYDNESYFTNCTFTVNNNTITPWLDTDAHVKMWEVRGVLFEGCTFDNQTSTPNYGIGIHTCEANFTVSDYCPQFLNCACTTTPTASKFENLYKGINVYNANTKDNFNVFNSEFINNIYAIKAEATNNFQIVNNNIKLNGNLNQTNIGIYIENTSGYKITNNNIYSQDLPNSYSSETIGIIINNSNDAENMISSNHFTNTNYAVKALKRNGNITSTGTGLLFNLNIFENNINDIDVCGTIRPNQGSSTKGANNSFNNNPSLILSNIKNIHPYYQYGKTINYFYSANLSVYEPIIITKVAKKPISKPNNIIELEQYNCFIDLPNIISSLILPATPTGNHKKDLSLYNDLQKNYNNSQKKYNTYGYEKLLSADSIDETDRTVIAARQLQDEILNTSLQMAEIANYHINKILNDSIFDRSLLNDWYNAINTLSAKYSLVNSYSEVGDFRNAYSVLATILRNFALDSLQQIEHNNFIAFLSLKEDLVKSGRTWAELNPKELGLLGSISVVSDGLSSSYAKRVRCFFYEDCDDQLVFCNYNAKSAKFTNPENENPSKTNSQIHIYPNPTTSTAEIINTNHETKIVKVEILSITGQTLQTFSTAPTKNLQINLSKLNTGLYFVKTLLDNNQEFIDKIVKE